MEVRSRVVLVTGASSGIGRAIAQQAADAGARVIVHGRDPRRTEETARGVNGTALTGDFTEAGSAEDLADRAREVHGRVDIVVASAGLGWSGPFVAMPAAGIGRPGRVR